MSSPAMLESVETFPAEASQSPQIGADVITPKMAVEGERGKCKSQSPQIGADVITHADSPGRDCLRGRRNPLKSGLMSSP